jgi:uncharacterized protein (DUF1800 family)
MHSVTAYNRFGLGARPTDTVLSDPNGWLLAQVRQPPKLISSARSATTPEMISATQAVVADRRLAKEMRQNDGKASVDGDLAVKMGNNLSAFYLPQLAARVQSAVQTSTPFAERLVHFWANHFAVSADKLKTRALGGSYENEAIRPHVTGRFTDLLNAAVHHPAMLLYLDNERSIGPGSTLAARRGPKAPRELGLNENLAREVLELHTLGVRSVYAQADVTELARALTGWSVARLERKVPLKVEEAAFGAGFYPQIHEPGARSVLGKRYGDTGSGQTSAILHDLALHPATATHIATKLVRHFVADVPPPGAIEKVARAFRGSDGHLPTVYAALVNLPELAQPTLSKFKTPWEYMVSSLRLIGAAPPEAKPSLAVLRAMGQMPMTPGSPAGWSDTAERWLNSDAMAKRIAYASALSRRVNANFDARGVATEQLGPLLSATTRTELSRAESGTQALTLLLASPEFMRR